MADDTAFSSRALREFHNALTAGSIFGVPRYTTLLLPTATNNQGGLAWDTTTNTLKGCNGTAWAGITGGGTVTSVTTAGAGTFTPAAGTRFVTIYLLGGGGGGGSGRCGQMAANRSGGGGGGGAGAVLITVPVSILTTPCAYVVGAGGAGGAAVGTASADGNPGTNGGDTTIVLNASQTVLAPKGNGGAGGTGTTAAGGTTVTGPATGSAGGIGQSTIDSDAGTTLGATNTQFLMAASGGGGGGGGINLGFGDGGVGGLSPAQTATGFTQILGGLAGNNGAGRTIGLPGNLIVGLSSFFGATGSGGGRGNIGGTGFRGGDSVRGAGGGGGGHGNSDISPGVSGRGGNGGDGAIVFMEF